MLGMLVPSLIATMVLGFSSPFVATVVANSCTGGNSNPIHTTSLTNPAVNPGSGTPSTSFTFSVTFTDNKNRPPHDIWTIVDGTQHVMSGPGAGFTGGVTFQYSSTLAAGGHSYSFRAVATRETGTGAGCTVNQPGG